MKRRQNQILRFSLLVSVFVCGASWSQSDTIVLNCGNTFDASGGSVTKPLRTLVSSLKSQPKAQKFRLIWWQAAASTNSQSTALYERSSKSLRYFRRTESFGLGYEGFPVQYQRYYLMGVTDAMLRQLHRKFPHPMSDTGDSYFSKLVLMGAKKQRTHSSKNH